MRKLSGLIMLLLLGVVLASCTATEEDEPAPTEAPTAPPVSTRITESTPDTSVGIPGTPAFDVVDDATPLAGIVTGAATPAATPQGATMPVAGASPVATPQVASTPEGTPAPAGMVVPPVPEPTATPIMIEMTGTIMLNGNENEAYVMTGEGCVGLGQHDGLHEGRQVVIRNEHGTIVSVTTLESAADADGCAWDFVASVPESEFYAVSIPMEFEQVFPQAAVADGNGAVVIEIP